MNKFAKYSIITIVVTTVGMAAIGATASWGEHRGFCDGDGEHGKSAMMHRMKKYKGFKNRDLDLTAEEAKTLVQARLIMRGNSLLKSGKVTEKNADTYLVDILTVDDSLVRQVEVDREKGFTGGPMMMPW